MPLDCDVLIIGGGAAGVGAARRLAREKLDALLVEAAPRLGGRAWTLAIGGHPLDMGCEYLHSADKNAFAAIAEEAGLELDRRHPAWRSQFRDLGFTPAEQDAADAAFGRWRDRLETLPTGNDRAGDALDARGEWNGYIRALCGYISGAAPEALFGSGLSRLRQRVDMARLARPARLRDAGRLVPADGRCPSACPPPSKHCGSTGTMSSPRRLRRHFRQRGYPHRFDRRSRRAAASGIPALSIPGATPRHCCRSAATRRSSWSRRRRAVRGRDPCDGNPRDSGSGGHYIRPRGLPVVETYFGGTVAAIVEREGSVAAVEKAISELAALFGSSVRRHLRPLVTTAWSRTDSIGGAYSYACPARRGTAAGGTRAALRGAGFSSPARRPTRPPIRPRMGLMRPAGGRRRRRSGRCAGEGCHDFQSRGSPSSAASPHLLPQGEKGRMRLKEGALIPPPRLLPLREKVPRRGG